MVLLLIACLVLAPVLVIALAVRLRARVRPLNLGWMSEQWLAAYRASHSD